MLRPLVLALVVCALGIAAAVFLSLENRTTAEDAAGRAPASPRSPYLDASSASNGAETPLAQADLRADTTTGSRATSWPDPHRGVFEILVVGEEDELPIAGARVWGELETPSEELGSRMTGADGRARWADLPVRALAMEATAPGRTTASVRLVFDPQLTATPFVVRLPTQRIVRVRLVDAHGMDAGPASLGFQSEWSGTITIGLAAECTAVGSRFDSSGAPTSRVTVDSWSGAVLAWRLQIQGSDPSCAHLLLGDLVLAAMPLDPRSTELAIPVLREDIQRWLDPVVVRVLAEATGEPIRGADVTLFGARVQYARAASDDQGRVRFEDLLAGEFQMFVTAPGFAHAMIPVRRPIAGEIEVLLQVGHDVDGVVLDPDGAPRANATLVAYDAAKLGGSAHALQKTTTDVTGRFIFRGLPAEEVVLVVALGSVVEDAAFLPLRQDLTPACHIVPCRGGAHDVVIRWAPLDPEKYFRGRAARGNH